MVAGEEHLIPVQQHLVPSRMPRRRDRQQIIAHPACRLPRRHLLDAEPGGTGSYEKFYFTPGSSFPVFDIGDVKVGIQICYDRKFPEGSRALAVQGAEILFMPICAASYGETSLRDNTWDIPLRARAYENGTFVVAVNRAGNEHGRRHLGRSMIISPIGARLMAEASEDRVELLVSTLDLNDVSVAQRSLPWWRDRRPDIYQPLVTTA